MKIGVPREIKDGETRVAMTPALCRRCVKLGAAVLGRLVREASPARSARERVAAVRERLRAEPGRAWRLDELAAEAGLSVPRFAQVFWQVAGTSLNDFLQTVRVQQACQRLATSDATVAKIGAEVGYEDPFYFARCFRRVMGQSLRVYRSRGGAGAVGGRPE